MMKLKSNLGLIKTDCIEAEADLKNVLRPRWQSRRVHCAKHAQNISRNEEDKNASRNWLRTENI